MKFIKSLFSSHIGMMVVCCAAMIGAYFLFAGAAAEGSILAALAPLVVCLGVHFLMMKMTGKSCHGDHAEKAEKPVQKEITGHSSKANG